MLANCRFSMRLVDLTVWYLAGDVRLRLCLESLVVFDFFCGSLSRERVKTKIFDFKFSCHESLFDSNIRLL